MASLQLSRIQLALSCFKKLMLPLCSESAENTTNSEVQPDTPDTATIEHRCESEDRDSQATNVASPQSELTTPEQSPLSDNDLSNDGTHLQESSVSAMKISGGVGV